MTDNQEIKRLLEFWFSYLEEESESVTVEDFSVWLAKVIDKESGTVSTDSFENELKSRLLFGQQLGQIINFTDYWAKLAFKDLKIRHFEDLTILEETREKGSPTKKHLASLLVNQKSTVYEIIKRLVRNGLLKETKDKDDKRSIRISLTKAGILELEKAKYQVHKMAELVTGGLSEDAVTSINRHLAVLIDFHRFKYDNGKHKDIDEVI